ncbi:MAG: serine/threonine-protein kinase, partial [Myxococcota bacterium]
MINHPEQFGKYVLLERLAIGGMAEIFKATSAGLGGFEKLLAIKRLHPRYSEDEDFVRMLVDEAKIAVELNHQNICQIYDLGRCNEQVYIAMEYLDGRDLYQILKRQAERGHAMPLEAAVFIATEICTGLDYAHRKKAANGAELNIIHRDISPQNIIVTWEGEVKIVDFGIAKASLRASETASGVIKGKFYYMSPEQARGDTVDARTDIFAMGIVLYELLTGTVMYGAEDDVTLLSRVRRAEIAPPTSIRADIPLELERIVMKALARDRARRYQSAHQMRMALTSFLYSTGKPFSRVQLGAFARDLFERSQVHKDLDVAGDYHGELLDRDNFMSQFSDMKTSLLDREQAPNAAEPTYRLDPEEIQLAVAQGGQHDLHSEGFLSDDEFFEGEDTAFAFMGDSAGVREESPDFHSQMHADGVYTGSDLPFEDEDTIATDGLDSELHRPQGASSLSHPDLHRVQPHSSSASIAAYGSDSFDEGMRTGIYSEPTRVTRVNGPPTATIEPLTPTKPASSSSSALLARSVAKPTAVTSSSPLHTPPPQPAQGGGIWNRDSRTLLVVGMALTFILGSVLSVAGIVVVSTLTQPEPEPQTVIVGNNNQAEATNSTATHAQTTPSSRLTVRLKQGGPATADIRLGAVTMQGSVA